MLARSVARRPRLRRLAAVATTVAVATAAAALLTGCGAGGGGGMRADLSAAAEAMLAVPNPMEARSSDESRRREADFADAAARYDQLRDLATDRGVLVFTDLPVGSDRARFLAAFEEAVTARDIPQAGFTGGDGDVSFVRITDRPGGSIIAIRIWSFPERHDRIVQQVRRAIDARW